MRAPDPKNGLMGTFTVRVRVFNLRDEGRSHEVEMTVDSGATYPVVPGTVAQDLGIRPKSRQKFSLADGRRVERGLARAGIAYNGRSTACMVVVGKRNDPALLGAHALEGLGLEVDPVAKKLRPATRYLL